MNPVLKIHSLFNKMESTSVTPESASEGEALKSLLETFGSAFSLQDIASAFSKAGRDPDLAGQILCETQTDPSSPEMSVSNTPLRRRTGFCETRYGNGSSFKAPMTKQNPVSMGSVSSVLGKNYVWRISRSNADSGGVKPLKVDASEFSTSMGSSDNSWCPNSRTSEEPSLLRDANLNDDVENFLFEMLGKGFQLERSAIQEVLGRCGYDMKKSLKTLLDLTAATLDKKYDSHTAPNLHPSLGTFSSQNQAPKQRYAESNRLGNNGIHVTQPSKRYEQQKEVLTSLFHAPERPDSAVTASVKSRTRSWATERVVEEPLEDPSDDHWNISTKPILANMKDDDDSAYQVLRKAVKEHRETMKEYYRAATEAFASGDRTKATILQEKGQHFYNKAREADEESALKIFETSGNDEKEDDMTVDLQDHQAKEAIQLVKFHLRSLSGIPSIKNLKVIIGDGGQDAEKRKRLVIKLLERGDIKWTEDETSGTILIRVDEINPKNLSFSRK